jgi:hypothetical protein
MERDDNIQQRPVITHKRLSSAFGGEVACDAGRRLHRDGEIEWELMCREKGTEKLVIIDDDDSHIIMWFCRRHMDLLEETGILHDTPN